MGDLPSRVTARVSRAETRLRLVSGRTWSISVVAAYAIVITPFLIRHNLWRDEAQLWLVGRSSANVAQFISNMDYEGHHAGWMFLIWPLARVSDNPELIKIVTWLCSIGAALIISRWLPLFRLEQLALLGGFLMALGFSVNSTGYMPGVLLLLMWVALFRNGRHPAAEILVAGLLATIHLLFFALAIPLLFWIAIAGLVALATRGLYARPAVRLLQG